MHIADVPVCSLRLQEASPIYSVEDEQEKGQEEEADALDLLGPRSLVPPNERGDAGELDKNEEDEEDAHHHPHV